MRVPLSWLQEFVPVEVGAEELSETFADLGFEVDGVEHVGEGLDGIVVARVLETWATSCLSPPWARRCPTAWRSPPARCGAR